MLLFVGNVPKEDFTKYYVIVEDIKYKVPTAVDALNLIFQLFFAVDIKYPSQSSHIWQVVQILCYNFKEPGTILRTQQNVLISDLKC